MSIKERVIGVMFALFVGLFGMLIIRTSLKEMLQMGPQVSGIFMLMCALFTIAAIGVLWISLTPQRWWPKEPS